MVVSDILICVPIDYEGCNGVRYSNVGIYEVQRT